MTYKNKQLLKSKYKELGSIRRVARYFSVSNGTIIHWMHKFGLPRVPGLHLYNNNSGKGRLGELYILGHPYFKNDVIDIEPIDDKHPVDLLWRGNRSNIKTSHYKRAIFRIKNRNKRHNVSFYICLFYIDKVNPLVPTEIWIIPSRICPYSNITPGLKSKKSKYYKYKLSLFRGKKFRIKEEEKYNKEFIKKYKNCLKGGKK